MKAKKLEEFSTGYRFWIGVFGRWVSCVPSGVGLRVDCCCYFARFFFVSGGGRRGGGHFVNGF